MADIELITTSDGSHSLFNTKLQETYHSVHGALRESAHVFIQHGLQYFVRQEQPSLIRILEVGFGTGLNALLALKFAVDSGIRIHYTTLETHPVEEEILGQLNYPTLMSLGSSGTLFSQLHGARWGEEEKIGTQFLLLKKLISVQEWSAGHETFDVVFFDAFAPSKQPAMWELAVIGKVSDSIKKGGVFVTYCAKGQLKRDLKSLGLKVETLAGPPGKKEMVRAVKS